MTPRQLRRQFIAANSRRVDAHNERAWLAYHIAGLPRQKKFPPLRRLMMHDRERRPQSQQQMQAVARQWTLLLGGKVETSSQ